MVKDKKERLMCMNCWGQYEEENKYRMIKGFLSRYGTRQHKQRIKEWLEEKDVTDLDECSQWQRKAYDWIEYRTKIVKDNTCNQYCVAVSFDRGQTILVPRRNPLLLS